MYENIVIIVIIRTETVLRKVHLSASILLA